ncbi:MAG: NADH-quinone oxidoreductase subunit J [Actinobacteria bacterium]|nr:NADH-quinone oxidoreductase subunit J [Actinomycetota bacterium]
MSEVVIFFLMAALALGAALGVVLAKNPVHSALLLVTVLVAIAVLFVVQDAQLLAAVQVIVYAGAIVVLFLFVIMLLGVDEQESLSDPVRIQRPAAILLGVIALAEVLFLTGHHWATGAEKARGALDDGSGGNVERVARSLFTEFLWPFEVTAVLLVAAVIGSVVLARRSNRPTTDDVDESSGEKVSAP